MNCPNCGAVCNDSTNFCPSCGTALKQPSPEETRQETTAEVKPEAAEEVRTEAVAAEVPTSGEPAPEAPETGKKKKKSLAKKIILAVGLVLLLALVAAAAFCIFRFVLPSSRVPEGSEWELFYNDEKDVTLLALDGHYLKDVEIPGGATKGDTSYDGKVLLITASDGTLYAADKNGITKISTEVQSDIVLSDNGNMVAYRNSDSTLFLFDLKREERSKIAEKAEDGGFILSPDGKALVYVVESKSDKYDTDLMLWFKDSTQTIANDVTPVAVSDKAQYIYYLNSDGNELYVSDSKGESSKISKDVVPSAGICFNQSYSEILFFTSDAKTYISQKGGEKEKISSKLMFPLSLYEAALNGLEFERSDEIYRLPSRTLINQSYYSGEGELYYVDRYLDAIKITSDVSSTLYTNGKLICYIKDSSLFYTESSDDASPEKIAQNISDFVMAKDSGDIFYINSNDELMYVKKGDVEPERIANDVKTFVVSDDGNYIFFCNSDDKLMLCRNKKKAVKVADDVQEFHITDDGKYCAFTAGKDDNPTLYFVKAGKKAKKVATNPDKFSLSKDGKELCYVSEDDERVFVDTRHGFRKIARFAN